MQTFYGSLTVTQYINQNKLYTNTSGNLFNKQLYKVLKLLCYYECGIEKSFLQDWLYSPRNLLKGKKTSFDIGHDVIKILVQDE